MLTSTSAFLTISLRFAGGSPVFNGIPKAASTSLFGGGTNAQVINFIAFIGVFSAMCFLVLNEIAAIYRDLIVNQVIVRQSTETTELTSSGVNGSNGCAGLPDFSVGSSLTVVAVPGTFAAVSSCTVTLLESLIVISSSCLSSSC